MDIVDFFFILKGPENVVSDSKVSLKHFNLYIRVKKVITTSQLLT